MLLRTNIFKCFLCFQGYFGIGSDQNVKNKQTTTTTTTKKPKQQQANKKQRNCVVVCAI